MNHSRNSLRHQNIFADASLLKNNPEDSQILKKVLSNQQIFPDSFGQILRHETRNLQKLKIKLGRDKQRINQDIAILKNEVFNILDDLRLSMHAHLDKIYQKYMEKHTNFKKDLQEIILMKDKAEIQSNTYAHGYTNLSRKHNSHQQNLAERSRENNITISQMKDYNNSFQKSRMLNIINEVQRQKSQILVKQQRQIAILTQYSNNFYQSNQFCTLLSDIKSRFSQDVAQIYQKGIPLCIRQIPSIINKNSYKVLDGLNDTLKPLPNKKSIPQHGQLSTSMQGVKIDWAEDVNLIQQKNIKLQDFSPLCGIFIDNQLVFGCRDGSIQVKTIQWLHISSNKSHKSSICCLATAKIKGKSFLFSGSDHGCSSIIAWDTTTWSPIDRYFEHNAAISAIIDLKDQTHILSTGYDKRINIYDCQKGILKLALGLSASPIINAVLNKSGTRLSVASLDKSIQVWQVVRNYGKVQSMWVQKKIEIDSLACTINSSIIFSNQIFVGCKDGKIKLLDIEKGEVLQSLKCCKSYITEMVIVQRQSKQDSPIILVWQYKEPNTKIVNTQTGTVSTRYWAGSIQYCCGVGPKSFFLGNSKNLCRISHQDANPEISLCRVQYT